MSEIIRIESISDFVNALSELGECNKDKSRFFRGHSNACYQLIPSIYRQKYLIDKSEEEKKEKSLRKQIQEKLIKFATRIPIFMYLSDYREHSLKDVIQELEPELFTKVTGLSQADFSLLVSLNVFDEGVMNDAVYKFKRYEDASLEYTGIHKKEAYIGLYNTVIMC